MAPQETENIKAKKEWGEKSKEREGGVFHSDNSLKFFALIYIFAMIIVFWTFVKTPPNLSCHSASFVFNTKYSEAKHFSETKYSETDTFFLRTNFLKLKPRPSKNWQKFQNRNVTLWFITLFIIILLIIQRVSSGYGQWCLNSLISRGIFQWRRYFVKDHGLHDYWK